MKYKTTTTKDFKGIEIVLKKTSKSYDFFIIPKLNDSHLEYIEGNNYPSIISDTLNSFIIEARNYALSMKTQKLFNVCETMRNDNKYGKVNAITLFVKNVNATKKLIHSLGMTYKTEID